MKLVTFLGFPLLLAILFSSCQTIDLYEKTVAIPAHAWRSGFKPEFKFTIIDTTSSYDIFIVVRHNEKYNFNNIWVNLTTIVPNDTTRRTVKYELPLANSEGWIGKETAMDDLYDHRILITPKNEDNRLKAGDYTFSIEQLMREDPLQNILNVGLRVEKRQGNQSNPVQ